MSAETNDTSNELLIYLRRNFPTSKIKHDWMNEPIIFISVDGKSKLLTHNKKFLVNKIASLLEDEWSSLDVKTLRRTIKKYLDFALSS